MTIYNPEEPTIAPRPIQKICRECAMKNKWTVKKEYLLIQGICDIGDCMNEGCHYRLESIINFHYPQS